MAEGANTKSLKFSQYKQNSRISGGQFDVIGVVKLALGLERNSLGIVEIKPTAGLTAETDDVIIGYHSGRGVVKVIGNDTGRGSLTTATLRVSDDEFSRGTLLIDGGKAESSTAKIGTKWSVAQVVQNPLRDQAYGKVILQESTAANSTWELTGDVIVGNQISQRNTGALQIDKGVVTAPNVIVQKGGKLSGKDKVKGNVKAHEHAEVSMGANGGFDDIGTLTIEGNFDSSEGGILFAEIATSGNDLLSVTDNGTSGGNATVGGRLHVSLIADDVGNIIDPAAGDYISVLTATESLNGSFDPLTGLVLPGLDAGEIWSVIYDRDDATGSHPWSANGYKEVGLLVEATSQQDLVLESVDASQFDMVTVNYRVDNQNVTEDFEISLYESPDGVTLGNLIATETVVGGAAMGVTHSLDLYLSAYPIADGSSLIAMVDSSGTVSEAAEYNNALAFDQPEVINASGQEDSGVVDVTIALPAASGKTVTLDWETQASYSGNPATPDVDFVSASGTVTFAPGETEQTISITVNDDTEYEFDEVFDIRLFNAENAFLTDEFGFLAQEMFVTATILDDADNSAPVAVDDDGGSTPHGQTLYSWNSVLDNDTDAEWQSLTAQLAGDAASGTVTLDWQTQSLAA